MKDESHWDMTYEQNCINFFVSLTNIFFQCDFIILHVEEVQSILNYSSSLLLKNWLFKKVFSSCSCNTSNTIALEEYLQSLDKISKQTRMHSSRMRTAPQPDPSTCPLGAGLETCKACLDKHPHWRPARHAGIPPARHAGIPPPPTPHGQNSWHTLLKILPCPKLRLRAVIICLSYVLVV